MNVTQLIMQIGVLELRIHSSVVREVSPCKPKLHVGSTQRTNFMQDNIGPFWMNEEERMSSKHDFRTVIFQVTKK